MHIGVLQIEPPLAFPVRPLNPPQHNRHLAAQHNHHLVTCPRPLRRQPNLIPRPHQEPAILAPRRRLPQVALRAPQHEAVDDDMALRVHQARQVGIQRREVALVALEADGEVLQEPGRGALAAGGQQRTVPHAVRDEVDEGAARAADGVPPRRQIQLPPLVQPAEDGQEVEHARVQAAQLHAHRGDRADGHGAHADARARRGVDDGRRGAGEGAGCAVGPMLRDGRRHGVVGVGPVGDPGGQPGLREGQLVLAEEREALLVVDEEEGCVEVDLAGFAAVVDGEVLRGHI